MNLLITVLLLLVCLLISNVISHYIPSIPTALIQVALGIVIAFAFTGMKIEMETEWFLLLFIAPLLYNDGRHFPNEELWKMRSPIFGNAIILVLLTTVAGGFFIHWLIPSIPLTAAFALAAILSPTDPVAVSGIAKRIHIPEGVLNLVRGESLINDASGLVAFKYAIAAVATGYFSFNAALFDFGYMLVVGAIFGFLLGLILVIVRYTLRKQGIKDVTFHSLLQLLAPFIIYIVTEELFHASGIIAVVAGGIVYSLIEERIETLDPEEKMLTENIWSIILFVLNGIVFILLGINIPISMSETVADPTINNWHAIGYAVAIGIAVLTIRFTWSYFSSYFIYKFGKNTVAKKPNLKNTVLVSLTGVRGAVTMAGALSIPYFTVAGHPFPQRSLILFLSAGVILFTLIAATVFLPLISRGKKEKAEDFNKNNIKEARKKIILQVIKKLKEEMNDENRLATYELISEYRIILKKILHNQGTEKSKGFQKKVSEVILIGLKAERKYIQDIKKKDEISPETFELFQKSLDHREELLSNNFSRGIKFLFGKTIRGWGSFKIECGKDGECKKEKLKLAREAQIKVFQVGMDTIRKASEHSDMPEAFILVISDYKRMINLLKIPEYEYNENREDQKDMLRIRVMDFERFEINRMYEAGEISNEQAKELRRLVNYVESAALYEYAE